MTAAARFGRCLAIALALLAPGSGRAEAGAGPREVIQETVDAVLAVLREPDLSEAERRARIETIAYARFDFEAMSKLVLGKSRRRFSPAQQQAFVREFRDFLSRSYGRRITRYQQEQVEVTGERSEARGDHTVKTRIVGGPSDGIVIQYRLRRGADGEWRVIDVKVEGTSLASNYRAQFGEVLAGGTPDDLLAWLRRKNASPAGGEEEVEPSATAAAGS